MGDADNRQRRLARMEESKNRYVAFWGVVCFVAFFLLGWPALIAWVGLYWAMDQFMQAMQGHSPGRPTHTTHQHKKRKRRCCD